MNNDKNKKRLISPKRLNEHQEGKITGGGRLDLNDCLGEEALVSAFF